MDSRLLLAGMRAVGIRELKNRLSEYWRMVRGGEVILINNRPDLYSPFRKILSKRAITKLLNDERGEH